MPKDTKKQRLIAGPRKPVIVLPKVDFREHQNFREIYECGCYSCHPQLWCQECVEDFRLIQEGQLRDSAYFYGGFPRPTGSRRVDSDRRLCRYHNADFEAGAPYRIITEGPFLEIPEQQKPTALDIEVVKRVVEYVSAGKPVTSAWDWFARGSNGVLAGVTEAAQTFVLTKEGKKASVAS